MAAALVKKGTGAVLLAAALMAILLLLSAASLLYYSSMTSPPTRASRHQRRQQQQDGGTIYYHIYIVILRKPPNADAMDEDAHRRWHQSFLPSTLTDSGKPRLLDSYYRYVRYGVYAFSARLTVAEIEVVAKKPGFRCSQDWHPNLVTLRRVPARTMIQGAVVSKPAGAASQK